MDVSKGRKLGGMGDRGIIGGGRGKRGGLWKTREEKGGGGGKGGGETFICSDWGFFSCCVKKESRYK